MPTEVAATPEQPRRLGRSTLAVLVGFISVAVLSLGTDQVLHVLEVYPPWGQPMYAMGLNLVALAYRCVYTVLGGYLTAALAPRNPMRHVLILGAIGFVLSLVGAISTANMNFGPVWYPVALVITAFPCVWLGGLIRRAQQR